MVDEIPPDELKEKIDNGEDVQIIDIRAEREFEEGHIPDAENIPMNKLTVKLSEYDWGEEIVVVCPIGQSSVQAARLIQSYEDVDEDALVASMEGGYREWEYELEA